MEILAECFVAGVNGAPRDKAQAAVWYRRAAAGNVTAAQSSLGSMHVCGECGLEKSDAKAVALFRLAAGAGDSHAIYFLGTCYRDGRGVPQDHAEAVRLFRLAADKGDAEAEADHACALMYGEGVEKDYTAALKFSRRSADKNNALGEHHLGSLYTFGWGVPRDNREAVRWLAKSAAQGFENAIKGLRVFVAKGVPEAAAALRRLGLAP